MLNEHQQKRLVEMLRDVMDANGISQGALGRKIGASSGTMSSAFSCKAPMREERWRMCCEFCGIDYDRALEQIDGKRESGAVPMLCEPTAMPDEPAESPSTQPLPIHLTERQCTVLKDCIKYGMIRQIEENGVVACFDWILEIMDIYRQVMLERKDCLGGV